MASLVSVFPKALILMPSLSYDFYDAEKFFNEDINELQNIIALVKLSNLSNTL